MGQKPGKTIRNTTRQPITEQDQQSNDYSLICRGIRIKNESAVVALCSVPCEALPVEIHAVITIEIMDAKREIWKADFIPADGVNKMCQKGKVRLVRIAENIENVDEMKQAEDFLELTQTMTVHLSWVIGIDKAEQLLKNIGEAVDQQEVNYSLTGESIESSVKGKSKPSEGDFHNCVTWARRMLRMSDLNVDQTKLPKPWKLTMIYTKRK